MTGTRDQSLTGNRWVLVGAVLYALEWVAIVGAGVGVPLGAGAPRAQVLAAYAGHADALGWAAGWFSLVLLGRILITVGLRSALRASGRPQPAMDLAVAAMTVSVTLEVAVYAVTAGAAWAVSQGAAAAGLRSLDAVAFLLNSMLYGPLGIALLCCGVAMWRSMLFTRALPVLALVPGAVLVAEALTAVAPRFAGLADALSSVVVLFWIWMLWTGVLLWVRTPGRERVPSPVAG